MDEYTLLQGIGQVDEHLIERAHAKAPARRRVGWAAGIAACLCVAAALVLSGGLSPAAEDEDATADNAGIVGAALQSDVGNSICVQERGREEKMKSVSDIALPEEDLRRMSLEELESYYGTALRPGWVPADLDGETLYGNGVFRRSGEETPYYDQNTLRYWEEKNTDDLTQGRSLTVTAAKQHAIHDVEEQSDDGTLSVIDGTEMVICHYEEDEADYYDACYRVGQTEVEVSGRNLTQEEFVRVLESLV